MGIPLQNMNIHCRLHVSCSGGSPRSFTLQQTIYHLDINRSEAQKMLISSRFIKYVVIYRMCHLKCKVIVTVWAGLRLLSYSVLPFQVKKKVNYSCNTAWKPIGLWDVEASTFSRESTHRCWCRPPRWSSGQSSWLKIRRPEFDSRHYQKKK
jgi:hypothetical protein